VEKCVISIFICSDNRGSLERTLQSLLTPENLKDHDWELILLTDAAGNPATNQVCARFQQQFPSHVRHLVQSGRGKSNAMNFGMAQARGEIYAMTDDDVLCAPHYLQGIRETFSDPAVEGAQGRILLDCEGGVPPYLHHDLAMFMGLRDYGEDIQPWNGNLAGTNRVVRAEVIRRVGGYAPHLGAGAIGFAEDTELSWRIRAAGTRLVYAPRILVRHQLPRHRLTKSFFRQRYFRSGRSLAYCDSLPVSVYRFGLYTVKEIVLREVESVLLTLRGRPAEALRRQCDACEKAGFFWEHWLLSRRRGEIAKVKLPLPER
jgi:cellulose synthase/poly-beta-1,6-N-acetylglucosamine synthase-like glycosyltransferase